ncbi:alpha/beta fold hydrolase [Roseomonas sp. E05]|uniref:alpha/beta fold hydrolase n=1 Tax=Roseomonas sp. E05 TaxID=3046310 RepID=UPI0024B91178|nr:alpha/beta fold hydrolase [Roseomonas sp. E05]MDJ0390867.1 alpha/beta fold hydrolase [Roseomonas sp. E05]
MTGLVLEGQLEGEGPPVILLHAVGLDGRFWGPLPAALAGSRRVLSLDLAGHGRSPAVSRPRPIADYAEDVAATIRQLGAGPAAVLGLSFGGMVAQELTLRHPELVSALIACGCGGDFPAELRPVLRERGHAAENGGMAAVLQPTLERWFTPGFRADPAVQRVRNRLLSTDAAGWSCGWHAIAGFSATPRLGGVAVPTLVIAGEQDAAAPPTLAERTIVRAVPGARLAVLPGAPHMMQIECGEAFTAAVAGFLRDGPT